MPRDALGRAAREHVAPEQWPLHQRRAGALHRRQHLQAMGQRRRHFLAARTFIVFRRLGQQQAGFQKRQPSRHDQIIGRDFEAQPRRCRDEGEILLGERQDRDPAQIDLLLARELQQQIDRPLEPVEIENQRRLAGLVRLAGSGRCRLVIRPAR